MQERRNTKQSYGPPKRTSPSSYPIKLEAMETFKNRILVNEYLDTIIQHLQTSERNSEITPSMIDLQPEVKWFMRPYLVNFIIQMHSSLKLKPQTLFLCWNIIDRYCAKRIAFRQHYQLIGCTSLWIASKYEDKKSRVPTITELSLMCNNVYEESMFKEMEMHILSTLNWCIGHTSVEDILQISIKLSNHDGKESVMQLNPNNLLLERGNSPTVSGILAISRYLCELSLYDRCYLNFKPSMIAITAHLIACSILSITTGVKSLESTFTEYLVDQLNLMVLNKSQPNVTSHKSNSKDKIPRTFVNDDKIYADEDEFVDEDDIANRENCDPLNNKIYGAFISGFHGSDSLKQIRTISILLFRSMNNPPEVLIEKYTPLGVINAVNNFFNEYFNLFKSLSKNLNLSNTANANNNSEYNEQVISNFFPLSGLNQSSNPYAIELSDYLLGLPTNMEQKIENSVYPRKSTTYPTTTLLDSPISSATNSSFNTPPSQPYRNKSFVTDSSPSSPSNFSSFSSVSSQTNYSSDTLSEPTNNSFVSGTTATIFSDVNQKKIQINKADNSFYQQQQQQSKQFRNIISNTNSDFNKSRNGSKFAESTYTLQHQQQHQPDMQQYHTETQVKPVYNSASYPSSSTITNNSSETDMGDQSSEGGNGKLPNSSPFSPHSGENYDNRNTNNDIMV
ncbi:hypothetical protein BVG19_g123 [[Candida] boidinii]|nr:hypothetical protein BVG19_g123 [[Candida] boidinii]OWB49691.1 hypothetical protein B5S27_g1233 [[Candida] boidinii]